MTNQEPASILLIDDHPMLRTGVKQLVSMAPDITVVGEASNGEQGIELAESLDPDLILLDLNMPGMNGLETLDKLREKSLSGRIVVFSVSNHEEDVVTALKRGADGYLLKDMEPEDQLKALQQAAAGEMVLSEALTPVLAASLRANRATSDRDVSQLTPRERDILKLIAQGLPNKMIARRLDITESTVKVHVKHMLKKMKLKSRVEAAVWVHQERIFSGVLLRQQLPARGVIRQCDQRLHHSKRDLIGRDALAFLIFYHRREVPAVCRTFLFIPGRYNHAPAVCAVTFGRRRQAQCLRIPQPVDLTDAVRAANLQLQHNGLAPFQIPRRRGQPDGQRFTLAELHHRQASAFR